MINRTHMMSDWHGIYQNTIYIYTVYTLNILDYISTRYTSLIVVVLPNQIGKTTTNVDVYLSEMYVCYIHGIYCIYIVILYQGIYYCIPCHVNFWYNSFSFSGFLKNLLEFSYYVYVVIYHGFEFVQF